VTPGEGIRPLAVRSVVDQVHARLLERIVAGDVPPGSRLPQEALAAEMGVSRTPLREALMRLASEGLVVLEANRGATVARRDFGDMRAAWQARLVLEPAAAALAARNGARNGALPVMREAIEEQRQCVGDVRAAFAANRRFHVGLVDAAANAYLSQLGEILWMPRIGVPFFALQADDPADGRRWADEHSRIADAVEAGDPACAERLTREHIAANTPHRPEHPEAPRQNGPDA
jgi:DNA-binding GntR family transcriptional regulator